ncbi:MAG: insulinase family protein [candidate division WOR-3 bacterium]|nr:insulinase family protein [candidate division WOR-3 bacterium]MCX7836769.1 insulinase family protein [candidate division WOR-3 bacterium]MDW8113593.1 pitrilysin family protein [candidate division WOR-3 bacterium]
MNILLLFLLLNLKEPQIKFPIIFDSLENGLKIYGYRDNKLPMVRLRVIIRAGSSYDPIGKEGLANLVVNMLLRGTKKRSYEELYNFVENLGGRLEGYCDYDFSQIEIVTLSRYLDTMIILLKEILTMPKFAEEDFIKLKREIIGRIKISENFPTYILEKEFQKNFYPKDYPYRHLPEGEITSLEKIEIRDIKNFYEAYYHPNNYFFILVGDFLLERLKEKMKELFSNLPRKEIPRLKIESFPKIEKKKMIVIKKKEINQSYILLGFEAPSGNNLDVIPLRVMNFIFGGGALNSRLGKLIREKEGLAYDVGSYFTRRYFPSHFICEMQTEIKNTDYAIDLIIEELKKLKEKGINKDELIQAKRFYFGNIPISIDSYSDKANIIREIAILELGLDYLSRLLTEINKLTCEKINEIAKRYIKDNFLLIIVSNIEKENLKIRDWETEFIEK